MCSSAICPFCNKKTWTGCGKHIDSVMSSTPHNLWCTCKPLDNEYSSEYPPKSGTGSARSSVSSGTRF